MDPAKMMVRAVNTARFDVNTIEAIEADKSATSEAGAFVALVAVIGSIGSIFSLGLGGFIATLVVSLLGWALWAFIAQFVASKLFGVTTTDFGEMARVTGYAQGPRVLGLFGFIPLLGWIFGAVAFVWSTALIVIGIRQAADFDTNKAVMTALAGLIPFLIGFAIINSVFG